MKLDMHGNTKEEIGQACKDWIKVLNVRDSCKNDQHIAIANKMASLYDKKYSKSINGRLKIGKHRNTLLTYTEVSLIIAGVIVLLYFMGMRG